MEVFCMKIKKIGLIIVFMSIFGILTACGETENEENSAGENGEESGDVTEISFSMDQPSSHIWVEAMNEFADLAMEKTNGSLDITIHDSASLGSQREALEGMQVGTMGGTVSVEPISGFVPEIGIYGVPYLFEDE